MKTNKIIYWSATLLLSGLMLLSVTMYTTKFAEMSNGFQALGYPAYLPAILAVAKSLGVLAIVTRKFETLREWAYAGFFFNFTLADAPNVCVEMLYFFFHNADGRTTSKILVFGQTHQVDDFAQLEAV